jgi:hypothetical protein
MIDNPTIHYNGRMLGCATDSNPYGHSDLPALDQIVDLRCGWLLMIAAYLEQGLITVQESARMADDATLRNWLARIVLRKGQVAIR